MESIEENEITWIPCELCDTLVRFEDFNAHLDECEIAASNMRPVIMGEGRYEQDSLISETIGDVEIGLEDAEDVLTTQTMSNIGYDDKC